MREGFYIIANDNVLDEAIAAINSIKIFCPRKEIIIIPYNEKCEKLKREVEKLHKKVTLFSNKELIREIDNKIDEVFANSSLKQKDKRPRLRNTLSWLGELDRFICMDSDILILNNLNFVFEKLKTYNFITCDDQYRNGIKWVFTEKIKEIFSKEQLSNTFNAGFWASRNDVIELNDLLEIFDKCKEMFEYFDFPSGAMAQPIINFIVRKKFSHYNMSRNENLPDPWVAAKNLEEKEKLVFQNNKRLLFMHWAGRAIEEKYFEDLWKFYRHSF